MNLDLTAPTAPTAPTTAPVLSVVNFTKFEARFAQIARRAKRLKVELPTYTVTDTQLEYEYSYRSGHGEVEYAWTADRKGSRKRWTGRTRTRYSIQLGGLAVVKLADWTFVATLDHELGIENTIVRMMPGLELPREYRHRGALCDHCRRALPRKTTYVVAHADGRLMQVGSTCLADFLGTDVGRALATIDMLASLRALTDEEGGDGGFGGKEERNMDLVTYLAWVAKSIREDGWRPRSKPHPDGRMPTADAAEALMHAYRRQRGA